MAQYVVYLLAVSKGTYNILFYKGDETNADKRFSKDDTA